MRSARQTRPRPTTTQIDSKECEVMCESTVYLMDGGTKTVVMAEAARVSIVGADAVVIGLSGERKTLLDVELSDADLMRHEIVMRPRKG